MKFYPDNDLYSFYKKYAKNAWLSSRVHDHTIQWTVEILNRAINCCDQWNSFIDIGAGNGRNTSTLLHKFKKGIAVEIDPNEALKEVGERNSNVRILFKPIQKLKLKEKIDFILLSDVFEHIPVPDVNGFLHLISGYQDKGGVVYVLTPNALFCGPAEKSGIYHKRHTFGHHKHYIENEVVQLFAREGYELVFIRFEDSTIRLFTKLIMISFSFLDKKYLSTPFVYLITSPFVLILDFFLWLLSLVSLMSEKLHQHDNLNTRSMVLVFKKIS